MSDGFKKNPQAQDFLVFAPLSTENHKAPNWRKFMAVETALQQKLSNLVLGPNLPTDFGGDLECRLSFPLLSSFTYQL